MNLPAGILFAIVLLSLCSHAKPLHPQACSPDGSSNENDNNNDQQLHHRSALPYVRFKWPSDGLSTSSNNAEFEFHNVPPDSVTERLLSLKITTELLDNSLSGPKASASETTTKQTKTLTPEELSFLLATSDSTYRESRTLSLPLDFGTETSEVSVTAALTLYGNAISESSVRFTYSPHKDYYEESAPPLLLDNAHVAAVHRSLAMASQQQSKLPASILSLPGMSGTTFRHFLNNLLSLVPFPSYLEIGVWAGSSFVSSIYGNNVRAVGIDNWSQFGGPKSVFLENVNAFGSGSTVSFFESSCWNVNHNELKKNSQKFSVYFFDGPHEVLDHFRAIIEFYEYLEETSVIIIDDWNFVDVRWGTLAAFEGLPLDIMYEKTIMTTQNSALDETEWHNGVGIFVVKKITS
ncbi:hypothetical protein TrVE_jg8021 [Triparma verrucosa]|uniref:Uncharacterized protein n=1 Tax=Triparma verrucosa TaxID=1606542 RepID=A0A9W7B622_9STRA|nr:hypothetical protein TrVE_jg8021 [Triparma verrucosa]